MEEEELNDPDPFTTTPTTNKDFWQHYSPTAWIDMYNESVRNVERITELYKESVKSTERMIELYKQSIAISERMIELYKENAKNRILGGLLQRKEKYSKKNNNKKKKKNRWTISIW
ncbi:MAG: hypothetical protein K0S67_2137 [Nitrososphaeraceae archaeon]|nr:hypothetical protein [Nitrososphaeraceae archaeon]